MTERRYSDDEAGAIFKAAAELQQAEANASPLDRVPLAAREGMTLAELQTVGREVGIPADIIARAASGYELLGRTTVRRFLGLPVGVGRTVPLHRTLTDAEWERLVVDLRETFDARGRLRDEGNFRQWTNGNLQALLEPTAAGHRIRMRTVKQDAMTWMTVGLAMPVLTVVVAVMRTFAGRITQPAAMGLMAAMGVAFFLFGAVQLPGWARTRQRQMAEIAARLTESTG